MNLKRTEKILDSKLIDEIEIDKKINLADEQICSEVSIDKINMKNFSFKNQRLTEIKELHLLG